MLTCLAAAASHRWGFDEFSHLKPVTRRSMRLDNPARYPPFEGVLKDVEGLRFLTKTLIPNAAKGVKLSLAAAGAAWLLRSNHSRL